jgi:hypothetical protein
MLISFSCLFKRINEARLHFEYAIKYMGHVGSVDTYCDCGVSIDVRRNFGCGEVDLCNFYLYVYHLYFF